MEGDDMDKNVERIYLTGNREFSLAFGVRDTRLIADYRRKGMPYKVSGKSFMYDIKACKEWLDEYWSRYVVFNDLKK